MGALAALGVAQAVLLLPALCADAIDARVRAAMQEEGIPGVAVAVVRSGRVIKAAGYGRANLEWDTPVTRETVFEIGSITKQFTAALVLMLAEQGRWQLDDPLARYLEGLPEAWRDITLRHLLTHTSGLRNYTGLTGFELTRKLDARRFIRTLSRYPLDFQPGERFAYCNSGYNLLGYALEARTGESYWHLLKKRVFKPLHMQASGPRDPRRIIPKRAAGYERAEDRLLNRDPDLTDIFSAGAMVSTVLDLARWSRALDGTALLSAASKRRMWTPVRLAGGGTHAYGFGWRLGHLEGHRWVGHSGSTAGFSAGLLKLPDDDLAVIVLCNLGRPGVAWRLALDLARLRLAPVRATKKDDPRS